MGRKLLRWNELITLLVEVEAVVNTRPLTFVYDEIDSPVVLTPAHFMGGGDEKILQASMDDPTDDDFEHGKASTNNLLRQWKRDQMTLDKFWKVWRDEYLLSLREKFDNRHKGQRSQIRVKPRRGDRCPSQGR